MVKMSVVSATLGVLLVLVILFIGFHQGYFTGYAVSTPVDNSCSDNQTIMLLSGLDNAHGAAYNQSYTTRICYSSIFPGVVYTDSNPHQCTGNNSVLNLSSISNAHAGIMSSMPYQIPICYGDLVCRNTTGSCNADEQFVVSLSSITNAHLSANNNTYANKICCSSANTRPSRPSSLSLVANITSPFAGDIYFTDSIVRFRQNSYAKSGSHIIETKWDLGNGTTLSGESLNLSYSQSGIKRITLIVKDNESNVAEDSAQILIADNGINVIPIINSPEDLSTVRTKSVSFDGRDSYVLNISRTTNTFDCVAGGCPLNISGYCGTNCQNVNNSAGKRGNYSSMLFNWSFGSAVLSQSGLGKSSGDVNFSNPGDNILYLKLTMLQKMDEATNRIFIATLERQCTSDRAYYWDGAKLMATLNSTGVCNLFNPSCCPSGYLCIGSGLRTKCSANGCNEFYNDAKIGTNKITLCEHYSHVEGSLTAAKDQCKSDCNNAALNNYNVLKANISASGYYADNYACRWNDNSNNCTFWVNLSAKTIALGGVSPAITSGIWEIVSDSGCNNGQETVTWCKKTATLSLTGTINSTTSCVESSTTTFSCKGGAIELPFFSIVNLLVSLVSIILIYLIFKRKRL
jgi:hypothetical protein